MSSNSRETILEFIISGQFGQMSAIDTASGVEASVIVPASTAKVDRERLVLRKLDKALAEQGIVSQSSATHENGGTSNNVPPPKRPGIVA